MSIQKEDFYAFLENAGCLAQWRRNLTTDEESLFTNSKPYLWIASSFNYSEATQSTEYWVSINHKWCAKCVELEDERRKIEQVGLAASGNAVDIQIGGSHYKDMVIQPIEYITKNNLPYIEGNIIKYVTRYKLKNGIEDLKKAKHYLEMLIEQGQSK